ncbi:MAG: Ig-like domain-containing protein [Gemmatimonadota bacterium]
MPALRPTTLALGRLCWLLLLPACGGGGDPIGPPAALEAVAGNNQSGTVGQAVAVAPVIRVRDASGHGLVGIVVRFTVTSGGGVLSTDSTMTDGNGQATAGQWTLGTTAGTNTLKAQALGLTTTLTISATALPGASANLASASGTNFAALVQQPLTSLPTVLVTDGFGNPVPGATVTFTVTQNNGTLSGSTPTTDAQGRATLGGWVLGSTAGLNRVSASAPGTNTIFFDAQGLATTPSIVAVSVVTQSGIQGAMVPRIPQVRVTNANGQVLGNVPVHFATVGGDAVIIGPDPVSDPTTGIAAPQDWRLGVAGTSSTVEATLPGFPGAKVTFTAVGNFSPYVVDVRFLGTSTPAQHDAFAAAAIRWMKIITGDIPDVPVNMAAGQACSGFPTPALNETIDDVVIFAQVTPIDGVGGILGSAGPCIRRTQGLFTAVGSMKFDVADLVGLQNTNRLDAVILHEMAHVLGFGTVWTDKGLLTGAGGSDPVFTGVEARAIWPTFNLSYDGSPVPVENLYGSGTRDSHWRENVLGAELMTGIIEAPGVPTPLSKLSIASMKDLGYAVSYATADAFAGNLRESMAVAAERLPINDIVTNARWEVTPLGVLRRVN